MLLRKRAGGLIFSYFMTRFKARSSDNTTSIRITKSIHFPSLPITRKKLLPMLFVLCFLFGTGKNRSQTK